MTYFFIAITFTSLLAVILIYNVLLGLFKRGFRADILQKISFSAFVVSITSSDLGLFYYGRLSEAGFGLGYPFKFETTHNLIQISYPYFLLLAPLLALTLFISINRNWKTSPYIGSAAIIAELGVLIATILI